jgi:glucan biosynthesis protein C
MNSVAQPPITPIVLTGQRFYALDACRALALSLGVFYHSIESFVSYIPTAAYPTNDIISSSTLDVFFFTLHSFRMQSFFLIAGFFAHQLYHRRGAGGFAQHRFKRLFIPFVAFWPIMFYCLRALRILGRQRLGDYSETAGNAGSSPWLVAASDLLTGQWFSLEGLLMPLFHLWFLYYLTLFCLFVVLLRPLITTLLDAAGTWRNRLETALSRLMSHWWSAASIGLVIALPMMRMKLLFGVDTPNHNLIPNTAPFMVYGLFFLLGWMLHRQEGLIFRLRNYRHRMLLLTAALTAGLYVYFLAHHERGMLANQPVMAEDYLYKALYGVASTTAVFAFLGYVIAIFPKPNPFMKYLADASYWIYLVHLPLVVALQIEVTHLAWPWPLKVGLIFGCTMVLLLLSYQFTVQKTWVGLLLNGKKPIPKTA